jgi:hypothetical protein
MSIPHPETDDNTVYVDCSVTQELNPATNTVTVPHLADETVDAVGDGSPLPITTCNESGVVTYDRSFSEISIGFPIEARIQLLMPELPANGTSQGKMRQVETQTLRLYRSLGGKVGTEYGDAMRPIVPLVPGIYELGSSFALFTGDKETDIPSYADAKGTLWIVSTEPLPFNLLAVITRFGILEV